MLDDLLRGRVPVQGRAGRVGEERDVLVRSLLPRDRRRRERARERDRGRAVPESDARALDSKRPGGRWEGRLRAQNDLERGAAAGRAADAETAVDRRRAIAHVPQPLTRRFRVGREAFTVVLDGDESFARGSAADHDLGAWSRSRGGGRCRAPPGRCGRSRSARPERGGSPGRSRGRRRARRRRSGTRRSGATQSRTGRCRSPTTARGSRSAPPAARARPPA